MADPLRNETGVPGIATGALPGEPVLDDQGVDELLAGFPPERTLPRTENPRLNRTAETIGSALGATVGRMRSGLSLVKVNRDGGPGLTDKISQKAEDLSATVREQAGHLGDVVQDRTEELVRSTRQRWTELRATGREKVIEVRHRAAVLKQDHPLELIGAFAGTAFIVGVALRVWRSNNND